MFEIFNVPGLYITVQAVLAIAAKHIISKWMLEMGLHTLYL
jgi:actin-related protein